MDVAQPTWCSQYYSFYRI